MKPIPVRLFPEFGLVSLNDSVVVPPVVIVDVPKDFNMAGGERTVRLAIATAEVPEAAERLRQAGANGVLLPYTLVGEHLAGLLYERLML